MPEVAAASPAPPVVPPTTEKPAGLPPPAASAAPPKPGEPPKGLVAEETISPAELEHRRRLVRLAQGEERSRKDREAIDKAKTDLEAAQKEAADIKADAEAIRAVRAAMESGDRLGALRALGLSDDAIADLYEKDLTDHYLTSRKDLTADEIADLAAEKAGKKLTEEAAAKQKKADDDAQVAAAKARDEVLRTYVTDGDTAWDDKGNETKWQSLRKLADMGLVDRDTHVRAYLDRAHRLYQETKKVPTAAEVLDAMDKAAAELPMLRSPVDGEGRKPSTTATADWKSSQAPTGEELPATFEERVAFRLKQAGIK